VERAREATVVDAGEAVIVVRGGRQTRLRLLDRLGGERSDGASGGGAVVAPMHGRVASLDVREGDSVAAGQKLAVVEAMKMEHVLAAPAAGRVARVLVEAGAQVAQGAQIVVIETGAPDTGEQRGGRA
jgi:3-methylcrotonyl-CoA carboxylase alpha subunit